MSNEAVDPAHVLALAVRDRAAVVGIFDPYDLVASVERHASVDGAEDQALSLLASWIDEVAVNGTIAWRLKPDVRKETLHALHESGRLEAVLASTRASTRDHFGKVLQCALAGAPFVSRSPDRMSTEDLMQEAVALDFVKALPGLRRAGADIDRTDPRILLARSAEDRRIDHVVPGRLFGREAFSVALDTYLAEGQVTAPFNALPEPADMSRRLRPLLLTGIGGSGKSALVADLVRRARGAEWAGAVVCQLDFDQRNVSLGGEREWLNELTRQIGIARPGSDRALSRVRQEARRKLNAITFVEGVHRQPSGTDNLMVFHAMRGEVARVLADHLKDDTLLVVLDTFEEILVRSDMNSRQLDLEPFGLVLGFLDSLSKLGSPEGGAPSFGRVRAVVAGRADPFPGDPATAGRWFEAVGEVDELDVEDAVAFLRAHTDRRTFTVPRARRVAQALPRYPLVLLLLAAFARHRQAKDVDEIVDRSVGGALLGAEAATRVLYSRFLDRLKDHEVKDPVTGAIRLVSRADLVALAHPGLALPVVTPSLIRKVLAGPTGLGEISDARARDLFAALSKEVWLVERQGDDAVRHMPVLRRLMLPMLHGDARASGSPPSPMRDKVRAVHRSAAEHFRSEGASEPDAATMAAYHEAFLGEVSALASDPAMVRQVLDLAGDDIMAMPIEARALLRREASFDGGLSVEETAALPAAQRRSAVSKREARRVQGGITSRHFLPDEGETPSSSPSISNDDLLGLESTIYFDRPAVTTGLTSSFQATTAAPAEGLGHVFDFVGNAPVSISASAHLVRNGKDIFWDPDTIRLVEANFAQAEFARTFAVGRAALEAFPREPTSHLFADFSDPMAIWIWEWALAALATGEDVAGLVEWDFPSTVESGSVGRARTDSTLAALAVATVALGRAPEFAWKPHVREAVASMAVAGSGTRMTSQFALRAMALSRLWHPAATMAIFRRCEVKASQVRLATISEVVFDEFGREFPGPAALVRLPVDLSDRLNRFRTRRPSMSEVQELDYQGSLVLLEPGRGLPAAGEKIPEELLPAVAMLLRGRTPELFDPVRAALGDAAAVDPTGLLTAVDEIGGRCAFWPVELASDRLSKSLEATRETDFALASLVKLADLAGVTGPLLQDLRTRSKLGKRFHAVADLVERYDALLLGPYRSFTFGHRPLSPKA